MFERFTDRARRALVLAQEEARALNHNYIGSEHILLGLLREGEGCAAQVLDQLGYELHSVRDLVAPGTTSTSGHIPYTPAAKKTLELALREALQLGHNFVAGEHLLLAICRHEDAKAHKLLRDPSAVRSRVLAVLAPPAPRLSQTVPEAVAEATTFSADDSFAHDAGHEMEARSVRVHLVAYSTALQNALLSGVPSRTLIEWGIPRDDIVRAREGLA